MWRTVPSGNPPREWGTRPQVPHPGRALSVAIHVTRERGGRAWAPVTGNGRDYAITVPRLPFVAGREPGDIVELDDAGDLDAFLRLETAAALEGAAGMRLACRSPRAYPWVDLRRLAAAYGSEIAGIKPVPTARADREGLGNVERAAKDDIAKGRELWARIGAWPWSLFGRAGKPPRVAWWENDEHVLVTWHAWRAEAVSRRPNGAHSGPLAEWLARGYVLGR